MMISEQVTNTAFNKLITSLTRFGNTVSIPHGKALMSLVSALTDMATGALTGHVAFPIPTGCGKSRSIVEWAAAVSETKGATYSMVVSASRIEALCTLKRDMVKAGVPEQKIGLIYAPSSRPYSEPFTTDNEQRQFLLCSHQLIRSRECNLALYNTYHDKPRDLCVYDESLFISDIETFSVQGLCPLLAKWIEHFRYHNDRAAHINISNWLTERKARIEFQYGHFEDHGINELPPPDFALTVEDEQTYARMFRKAGDPSLADFVMVNGLPLRMFKYGKAAVISYRIVIPDALKNIIVLDASYPIRQLVKIDSTLVNAESLPYCQRERISFDNLKRFDHVTLYRMPNRGSRSAAVENKTKLKHLMQDTVEVIKTIPAGEGILVFVYLEKNGKYPDDVLTAELKKAKIKRTDLHIETWGNETSLNTYAHCKHVFLVGILHRDLSDLAAQYAAQLVKFNTTVDGETLSQLCLSERTHCSYQALSRGAMRVMGDSMQASAMCGYIVEFEDGLEEQLTTVMPGATWKVWTPVYSDLVEHGKLIQSIAKALRIYLTTLAADVSEVSAKRVWSDLGFTRVNRETRSKAVELVLSALPQWIQLDQWFKRVKSTVTFSGGKLVPWRRSGLG